MIPNLNDFDAVLLDLDGTVYHEEQALPGAVDLIRRLQHDRRHYACLTNSTSSPQRLVSRLRRMGAEIDANHIYTAAAATAGYVLARFGAATAHAPEPLRTGSSTNVPVGAAGSRLPRVFNLSTEGIAEMLDGKVQWVQSADESCDAVICGVPLNVFATEERQRTAMILLRTRGAALIAICADRVYPSPRGLEFGVGATAAMLAYAAAVTPVFCGKPEALFFHELCNRLEVAPDRCLLIGDNLESDIAGGLRVGMKTILTLTGVSSAEDAARQPPALRPDWIIDSLLELQG